MTNCKHYDEIYLCEGLTSKGCNESCPNYAKDKPIAFSMPFFNCVDVPPPKDGLMFVGLELTQFYLAGATIDTCYWDPASETFKCRGTLHTIKPTHWASLELINVKV